jgi:hypothetical protein
MKKKKRLLFFLCFLSLFIIETLIALFVHDRVVRPYIGDVLVTMLVYYFVRIFIPYRYSWLPLYVFIFACGIEFLQYLRIIEILGWMDCPVARTVIGTSFSWIDILCYGAGCLICGVKQVHRSIKDKKSMLNI